MTDFSLLKSKNIAVGDCSQEKSLAPWKKSYDKSKQHIKKQRHHKGPSIQSYGFSSNHAQMWELDHKEGWSLKNWCFQIVVLGKTLERRKHHGSKASILQCSAFFVVWLSHLYITTEKTIALTRQTFVCKVMFLLFNMLSRFVIAFLPRSMHLLIFVAAVTTCSDFGAQENEIRHCFHFSPSICHEVMGPDAMIFVFWMLSFKPAFSLSFTFIKRLFILFLSWPSRSLPWNTRYCLLSHSWFPHLWTPRVFAVHTCSLRWWWLVRSRRRDWGLCRLGRGLEGE